MSAFSKCRLDLSMVEHPDDHVLQKYMSGTLVGSYDAIDQHLESCDRCADQIARLDAPKDELLQQLLSIREERIVTPDSDKEATWLPLSDRFQLGRHLAQGGMGEIRLAIDLKLKRRCALKIMLPAIRAETKFARFFREAQITGSLQHPGIPPVYDVGRLPDERPFIAIKLIEGRTLKDLLDQERDPKSREAHLAIFRDVCQTIAYAHSEGVVHCDLKPDNIMVGSFGEVQVMDWGLANRVFNANLTDSCPELELGAPQPFSREGSAYGTPGYMSPEQARGNHLRVRQQSDVFSLGAILYEILFGDKPYSWSSTPRSSPNRIVDLTESLIRVNASSVDKKLKSLVTRCLAEDISQRPHDAGVVSALLNEHLLSAQERARVAEAEVHAIHIRERELQKRRTQQICFGCFVVVAGLAVLLTWAHFRSAINGRIADQRQTLSSSVKGQLAEAKSAMAVALANPLEYTGREDSALKNLARAESLLLDSQISDLSLSEFVAREKLSIRSQSEELVSMRKLASDLKQAMAGVESMPIELHLAFRRREQQIRRHMDGGSGPAFGRPRSPRHSYVRPSNILGTDAPVFALSKVRAEMFRKAFDAFGLSSGLDVASGGKRIDELPSSLKPLVHSALNLWSVYACDSDLPESDWLCGLLNQLDENEAISDTARTWRTEARAAMKDRQIERISDSYWNAFAVLAEQPPELIYALSKYHFHFVDSDSSLLRNANLLYPNCYEINNELAQQATSSGMRPIDTFHHAVAATVERPETGPYLMLARSLFRLGRRSEVPSIFKKANPKTGFQLSQWGALFAKHAQPGVTAILNGAIKEGHPEPYTALSTLANWHLAGRRFDKAAEAWSNALEIDSLPPESKSEIEQKLNDLLNPSSSKSDSQVEIAREISPALRAKIAKGEYELAWKSFKQTFSESPNKADVFGYDGYRIAILSVKHSLEGLSSDKIAERKSCALSWLDKSFRSVKEDARFLKSFEVREELAFWLDDELLTQFESEETDELRSLDAQIADLHRQIKTLHDRY